MERHVDSGRDSGGGDDLAVLDDSAFSGDGAETAKVIAHIPVAGGRDAVEDSGGSQEL